MNQLVLSGTATLVLSGTRSSCYRGPESSLRACFFALSGRSNFTNQKSFGFLLTHQAAKRIRGGRQSRPVRPSGLHKPYTHFPAANTIGSQFECGGATA